MAKLADPRPALCSACGSDCGDGKYIDFEASHDGFMVLNEDGSPWFPPNGEPSQSENIYIGFGCMRAGMELVDFKPELHRRQSNEINRLRIENEHWRDQARSWKDQANRALDPLLGEPSEPVRRGPGRPRKVMA